MVQPQQLIKSFNIHQLDTENKFDTARILCKYEKKQTDKLFE